MKPNDPARGAAAPAPSEGGSVRFRPPRAPGRLLRRDRLLKRVAEATAQPLTTLFSAAGYGKTTLLAEFASEREAAGQAIAWVSLTEADRDGLYFLQSIVRSFHRLGWRIGERTLSPLQSGEDNALDEAADALLDTIARRDDDTILILDDFHIAESPAARRVVEALARSAPRNFAVVLSSRTVPALNLARLRVRGQVAEISGSELRFDALEAEAFLSRNTQIGLEERDLDTIHRIMDGWAMGLQVAAISIAQAGNAAQFVERAAQEGSDISTFLATDILAALDDELRSFLRDTAHLEILAPELCDACANRSDSRARLQDLARLNLFVQAIEDQPGWYRYHQLFRSFLKAHFKPDDDPKALSRRRRSYEWFAQNGQQELAIEHALEAGMGGAAREALEGVWKQLLTSSRYEQLQNWLRRLPQAEFESSPALQIAMAWADALQRRLAQAKDRLVKLIDQFQVTDTTLSPETLGADPTIRDILVLKAAIDWMRDESDEIARLSDIPYEACRDLDSFSRGLLLNYVVYGRVLAGKFDLANRLAETAHREQIGSGDILVALHCQMFAGLGRQMTGDLAGATRAFIKAADLSSAHFGFSHSAPQSLLASIYYEWADLAAAARCLEAAQSASAKPSVLDPVIAQYMTAAKLAHAKEGVSAALEILAKAERQGREDGGARLLISALSERVKLLLANGRLSEAQAIEEELVALAERRAEVSHETWPMSQSLVAQARAAIRLQQGDAKAAQAVLAPFLARATTSGRAHPWIKLSVLDVLACAAAGKDKTAIRKLAQTIARAAEGRYVQVFVEHLTAHRSLVSAALTRCALDGVDKSHLTNIGEAMGIAIADWAIEREDPIEAGLDLSLTAREQDLLRALGAGMSNKAIARDMSISDNTVAWHLKNLFQKLGVNNRTAAVATARKHGLLD